MIFNAVNKIEDKTEKNFFVEQVLIFIRLVEVFCEKNNYIFPLSYNELPIDELINIGVIENANSINDLEKVLGSHFNAFICSVCFAALHKIEMNGLLDNLYNSKRLEMQEQANKINRFTLADFFCGAGGLSLGFIEEGFTVKLANDIEDVCIETYKYNHPGLPSSKVIKGDIKNIVDNISKYVDGTIDIVVGGPPCQGFSEANRQRIIDDPRNKLYKYFIMAVEKIQPKFVLMENVKGMLKVADQVVEDYKKLIVNGKESYLVGYKVLNSQDFSVAQSRERLIYIAIRTDVALEKNITPQQIFENIEAANEHNEVFNLSDALEYIKPLEAPRIKNMNEVDSDLYGKKIDVNNYSNCNSKYLSLINMNRNIDYTYNHKARFCNDINYEIYKRLNQGDDATNEKIADIMPYAHRNHCFKDKYYKLIANKPSRTIPAHLRMDCHSHIHPFQIRAITPREAARIQSFPDDYLFLGAYLKTYMQIGNAVPPLMARGIAKEIKKYL